MTMFVRVWGAPTVHHLFLIGVLLVYCDSVEVDGRLDECDCSIDSIRQFNSFRIAPQLQAIVLKDYFRYFKVDLKRSCPFWEDDAEKCRLKDCSVEVCDGEVPFLKAEEQRLVESGSGEVMSDELRSSSDSPSSPKLDLNHGQDNKDEVPYYERVKTQSQTGPSEPAATSTKPADVGQTVVPTATENIRSTKTQNEIKVTMATTFEATSGLAIDAGSMSTANETSRTVERENERQDDSCREKNRTLGKIDNTISDESRQEFEEWKKHDDKQQDFCVFDDEHNSNARYYDLTINPERFTGYSGEPAHKVWRTIYGENCFKAQKSGSIFDLTEMCYEQRVFYRAISGLHSSINIHLCAEYYLPDMGLRTYTGKDEFGPNLDEYNRRFSDEQTNGEGSNRLRNLYFLYLLELRALSKAAPFLERTPFYTVRKEDAEETQAMVKTFLRTVSDFKDHFDENRMFSENNIETINMKKEFREHFRNISLIMDCVGCDKCRLWGKLQTQGLGTALKILFSNPDSLDLSRTEIVTLFNAMSRLSNSLVQIEHFKELNSKRKSAAKTPGYLKRRVEL